MSSRTHLLRRSESLAAQVCVGSLDPQGLNNIKEVLVRVFIFSAHVCIGSLDLDDPEEVCIQSRAPGSAMLWQNMLLDHLILISK